MHDSAGTLPLSPLHTSTVLILKEGQRPLLEFLRNLTPQVLLATTALLLWVRLDFRRIDLSNLPSTVAFFFCVGLFCLAFLANLNQFVDALLDNLGVYARFARRERMRGLDPRNAVFRTFRAMFRHRPTLLLDFLGTVIVANIGLLTVTVSALNAVRAALR
ncbi:hypothetical protein [Paenacidovorax monticola]|uniref:ABC transporter permease n=1 Tax=Paenacidovorax monticola TaxID=1926868 RepID=A0A7H0HG32_9BURK|nr:hypothetical protein [Paenacidovorax monticola]QNP59498.1 hypothetical protein H9L24_00185 [Paenacidovorax monticola]